MVSFWRFLTETKTPVAVIPARLARLGSEPVSVWEKSSLWYYFPPNGDYQATFLTSVPLTDDLVHVGASWNDQEQQLRAALPVGPDIIYRIGRGNELDDKNAANLRGLIEFIDLLTHGGDYNLSYVAPGRVIAAYRVSLGKTNDSYKAARHPTD